MVQKIVLLSGPVCSGKSTLAKSLAQKYGLIHVKTVDFLKRRKPDIEESRETLQEFGERLDRRTGGGWVRDDLEALVHSGIHPGDAILVIDAVRIGGQIDSIRKSYGRRVQHIHLTAPYNELARRYRERPREKLKEFSSYRKVQKNKTEAQVGKLADVADVVVDSNLCTENDVVVRAASHIGLYGKEHEHVVDVLVGGQYGSEGKGHISSYLASEYDILIRVGGPNAGHWVYREPEPYAFHLLPSGTIHSDARLILGPGSVIDLKTLMREVSDHAVDYQRLSIDPNAMIITEQDIKDEKDLAERIGSTQKGVGAATARKIMGRGDEATHLARDTPALHPYLRDTREILDDAFRDGLRVFVEGTQGTGLSIHHGQYPYVTSRDTTVSGCLAEAGISPRRVRKVIMVCRTLPIRVESPPDATSGNLEQERQWEDIAHRSGKDINEILKTEKTTSTNRDRRVGEFDWSILRASASLNAPTDLALTHVDYLKAKVNEKARRYEQLDTNTIRFIEEIERVANAPASLISVGFHSRSIIDRRSW